MGTIGADDDRAVDLFAEAMKDKLAMKRAQGRGGWEDPVKCPPGELQKMLADHIEKGDPVDVGNFAMMIWNRGESVTPEPVPVTAESVLVRAIEHMRDRAATYDSPAGERSVARTVAAFNALTGLNLTEEQGWLFMICLKAARSQQGAFRADSYEDGAAYFSLACEAAKCRDVSRGTRKV